MNKFNSTNQPKVCFLLDSFYPVIGGGEIHARLLCETLVKKGVEVFVLTQRRVSASPHHEIIDGYHVYRVWPRGMKRWGKYLMIFPSFLFLFLQRKQYDIIYVCGLRTLGFVGVSIAKLLNKKCILRSESCGEISGTYIFNDLCNYFYSIFINFFLLLIHLRNRILRECDAFVSISSAIKNEAVSEGFSKEKIVVIPNGINTIRFMPVTQKHRQKLRKKKHLPDETIITYTGKLNMGKGLECLLASFNKVAEHRANLFLLLVGSGSGQYLSCEDLLKEYVIKNNLKNSVIFTGYTDMVHEYLQCSNLFVLVSESEALGISLIEAMSCGLPVIGTRTGGILDIIIDGENGRLIDVGDIDSLVELVEDFLANPGKWAAYGIKARESIIKTFNIDIITQKHISLFTYINKNKAAIQGFE